MSGYNLGNAYVSIMPSMKGMKGQISSQIGAEGHTGGSLFGSNFAATALKVIAASGLVMGVKKLFSDALAAGGALQQSFGGLDTIYGDASESMKEMAYNAAQAGISANSYAEQAVSFGASLKQAFGGDTVKAAEAANTAIMDMADNAAKMGTDVSMIQNAYQGFAKQNYTMLDNLKLGYGGTKTEMERLLADAEALTGVKYDMSNLGDVYEAIHVIQGELGLTGVAAAEGAETFTGSMAAMKASWQNLLANMALGEDIKAPLKSLVENAKAFLLNNFLPMVGNILKQLPVIIGEALRWAFDNIPGMIDSAIAFMNNLAQNLQENSGVIKEKLVEIGHAALEMFRNIDWYGLGKAIINLIWAGIQVVAPIIWELLKWIGQTAWNWFKSVDWPEVGRTVIRLIKSGLENLGHLIWEGIKALAKKASEKFGEIDWQEAGRNAVRMILKGISWIGHTIWENIKEIGIKSALKMAEVDWPSVGRNIITGIWNGLKAIGNFIWGALKEIGITAWNWFNNINWIGTGKNVITFIWNGLKSIGSWIWEKLKNIGTTAWNWFNNINWVGLGKNVITFIWNGITGAAGLIADALSGAALRGWWQSNNINWSGLGSNISNGITNGINWSGGGIVNSLVSWCYSAWASAKRFLGINSPSKLFANTIGIGIPEGIAKGIDDNAYRVTDSLMDVAKESLDVIDPAFAYNAVYDSDEGAATPEAGIVINVQPSAGMDERALADMVQQRLALALRQRQAAWGTA